MLKIVIFTRGQPQVTLNRFIRYLAKEENIEISAIVVDQFKGSPFGRARFLLRKWGLATFLTSTAYQVLKVALRSLSKRVFSLWHDRFVPDKGDFGWDDWLRHGLVVHLTPDIHGPEAIRFIRDLEADLGIIVGGRILKDRVTTAPRLGTLNIHKHDASKYRGGPQIGYPECANGDQVLTVTIHYATSIVDAGDIVLTRDIPIERFDTDESLAVKANVQGMQSYLQAICEIRDSRSQRRQQSPDLGEALHTTPYLVRDLFWRRRRRALRRALVQRHKPLFGRVVRRLFSSARNILAMALLPISASRRRRLEAEGNAPIIILYYHSVGNAAENWDQLPLEEFDRQVLYLKKHFSIISLDEAIHRLRTGNSSEVAAVLTFDDGLRSTHDVLLPYLSYYRIPASFFVCAGASLEDAELEHNRSKGYLGVRLLTPEQVTSCFEAGVTIGSHGNHHENFASLAKNEFEEVLVSSAKLIGTWTGVRTNFLSYPVGSKKRMTTESMEIARQHYDTIFSAYGGYNHPGNTDQFHYNRLSNPTGIAALRAIANGFHRPQIFKIDRPTGLDM